MASQLAADLARGGHLTTLVDTKAAAEFLKVSASFLHKARLTGRGPDFVKIGAAVRYEVRALEAFVASRSRSSTSNSGIRAVA
ncbi:MAG: hypothetical protein ACLQLT_12280 [Methylovirgula sp.]